GTPHHQAESSPPTGVRNRAAAQDDGSTAASLRSSAETGSGWVASQARATFHWSGGGATNPADVPSSRVVNNRSTGGSAAAIRAAAGSDAATAAGTGAAGTGGAPMTAV